MEWPVLFGQFKKSPFSRSPLPPNFHIFKGMVFFLYRLVFLTLKHAKVILWSAEQFWLHFFLLFFCKRCPISILRISSGSRNFWGGGQETWNIGRLVWWPCFLCVFFSQARGRFATALATTPPPPGSLLPLTKICPFESSLSAGLHTILTAWSA